jgi:hypothetical protein
MRALIGLAICGLLASACGGAKKPAVDPTASAPSSDEETKWDSSSETAETARRSKSLSASSRSGSSDDPSNAGSPSGAPSGEALAPSPPQHQRRSDEYDKEGTEIVLKRAARLVKANCGAATDEDGKASGPWGAGSMTLVLGHNGHMKDVSIGSPFDGKPTGRCAIQAFKLLTYPPWAGSDMTIDYAVEIAPVGAANKKK